MNVDTINKILDESEQLTINFIDNCLKNHKTTESEKHYTRAHVQVALSTYKSKLLDDLIKI